MDEPQTPGDGASSPEAGVSARAYDRIVRDLEQRQRVASATLRVEPAVGRQRRRRPVPGTGPSRAARVVPVVVGVVLLLVVYGPRVLPSIGGGPDYAFMETEQGRPVTYSSCKQVQVAVYPAGGPPDAESLVREAVAQVRAATGLDIVVTGSFGGYAPNWNFKAAPVTPTDPVVVSWQDATAIEQLTDDVAGLGGSYAMTAPGGTRYWVAGAIALSRDFYAYLAERGDHAEALAVLLHEFGHVLGLAHVHSSGELMNEDNVGRTTLGDGDREGLRLLGQGPCV
ncbi:matrixin family metalloprotease [Nocardioides anomalus]|uniref:Matrixin family metalloprotease n=1 Tax=Nocardioides anomalus TaxID=2712223 RepID=A0A6G6WAC3_9ACTN|nr:matrixin family metalloprotease [Nocardioides anomalus]QIG42182.1 matrixin family metalloprotease [Nocardioides anomalus]